MRAVITTNPIRNGIVRMKVLSINNPHVVLGVLRYENVTDEECLQKAIDREYPEIATRYDLDTEDMILMRCY